MGSMTLEKLTDPYIDEFRPVPPAGVGVCDVCHSGPGWGWSRCYSCTEKMRQVSRQLQRVVPISLVTKDGSDQLYHTLRSYKGFSSTPYQLARIAGALGRFVDEHGRCLLRKANADAWDIVTTVPSTKGKDIHPLTRAVKALSSMKDQYQETLWAGEGPFTRDARDDMYVATADVSRKRILLIDDTFTTGAHVQSAASTLQAAGATIVAAVVVGRIINPDYNDACSAIWHWSTNRTFDFSRCCICTADSGP